MPANVPQEIRKVVLLLKRGSTNLPQINIKARKIIPSQMNFSTSAENSIERFLSCVKNAKKYDNGCLNSLNCILFCIFYHV